MANCWGFYLRCLYLPSSPTPSCLYNVVFRQTVFCAFIYFAVYVCGHENVEIKGTTCRNGFLPVPPGPGTLNSGCQAMPPSWLTATLINQLADNVNHSGQLLCCAAVQVGGFCCFFGREQSTTSITSLNTPSTFISAAGRHTLQEQF